MLSATDEKTPYEQGENRTVQSVAARSIAHKFFNVSRHVPSLKEYSWVYCEIYVWPRSVKDLILHGNRKSHP